MRPASNRKSVLFGVFTCTAMVFITAACLTARGNSGCVYPIGAETVTPGLTPAPGQTVLAEFNTTYQANGLPDGQGHGPVGTPSGLSSRFPCHMLIRISRPG